MEHITYLPDLTHLPDTIYQMIHHISDPHSILAQQFKQDIMGDITKAWNNFVKSGQIWALLIGLIVGYLFRTFIFR